MRCMTSHHNFMKHHSEQTEQPQSEGSRRTDKSQNPRRAATKLKEMNNHIETMKRRFKVLQGQQDYNRYRTLDQEKRINQHQNIHSVILKEREDLRKSMERVNDKTNLKLRTEKIREQLKQKVKQAKVSLAQEKTDRYQTIVQEEAEHEVKIKDNKIRDEHENRDRKMEIRRQEEVKRETVNRHRTDRVRHIRLNKSIDAGDLNNKTERQEKELSYLMAFQQQLLKKNSESLQASQVMRNKFNSVFPSTGNSSRFLPQIRSRTNQSQQSTGHSQIVMI